MLVEWMFEHDIFIVLAIVFAIPQMCLCIRYKQFPKNAKKYNKIFYFKLSYFYIYYCVCLCCGSG